jgi:hypothetical protein
MKGIKRSNKVMATTQVNPSAASEVEDAASESAADNSGFGNDEVKSEHVDYYRFQKLVPSKDDPTKQILDVKVYSSPSDKLKADMAKDGYEIAFVQTVLKQMPTSWDSAKKIIPDDDERTGVWVRGLTQKLSQKLNALFGATKEDGTPEWAVQEGVYDPKAELNEPTNRRNLTQDERTIKMLKDQGYPDAVIMQFFQTLKANAGQPAQQS